AQADAWSSAKRYIGIARKQFLLCRSEPIRIELFRLRKSILASVQCIWNQQNSPAFAHAIATDLDIIERASARSVSWRIESERLLQNLQAIGQALQIGICWCAALQNRIHLKLHLAIHLRMLTEQIPHPAESGSSRFIASAKERQTLSHHLLIAHRLVLIIPGLEQKREKIVMHARIGASFIDKALHIKAQERGSLAHPAMARQRPAIGKLKGS